MLDPEEVKAFGVYLELDLFGCSCASTLFGFIVFEVDQCNINYAVGDAANWGRLKVSESLCQYTVYE